MSSMFRMLWLVVLLSVATFAGACDSTTTLVTTPDPGGIAVTGTGKVTVVPDIAVLNIGVEVHAPTVAEARRLAATAADAVQTSIKSNGVNEKDIRTQGLRINPEYSSRPTTNGRPAITGYVVANTVTVKVRDLDKASKTLDDAVAAGGDATRVNGISFAVDRPEQFLAQAREQAVKDAHDRADNLAKLAGVELGKPRSINESSNGDVIAVPAAARAAGVQAEAPTPINPGESEITLQVHVVYALK